MRLILSLTLSIAVWAQSQTTRPIRWACIGNSITQGPSATEAYPAKLQKLLGAAYEVENDGVSGKTLLRKGDYSYWTQGKLTEVFKFQPDIITIKLGTNDSKPINWNTHSGEFEKDLTALIDTLGLIPTKPKIWLVIPCPAFSDGAGSTGIRGSIIKDSIIPLIKKVAAAKNLNIIDVYTPMLKHPEMFADNVHPNAAGHDTIAGIFFKTYLSKVTRVSCIGNSITEYTATAGTLAKDSYSSRLNMLLGQDFWVENDGKSGAYMMNKPTVYPYWNTGLLPRVFTLKPGIITIKLGTNDARRQYWDKVMYLADYRKMVDSLSTINPKPKIWLCLPVPSFMRNGEWQFQGINDSLILSDVIPSIKQIALEKGLTFIDLHTPMVTKQALVPDGVHPMAEGQDTIAHLIYRALTAPVVALAPTNNVDRVHALTQQIGENLYVTYPGKISGAVRLYTSIGALVASTRFQAGETANLSLTALPQGLYYLSVETAQTRSVTLVTLEGGNPR
jgi:acyl-CoA thioesterase I